MFVALHKVEPISLVAFVKSEFTQEKKINEHVNDFS